MTAPTPQPDADRDEFRRVVALEAGLTEDEVRELGDVGAPTPQPDVLAVLDELDALRAAATPGPWTERQDFIDQGVPDNSKTLNGPDGSYLGTVALSYRGEDHAALIVAAVNRLPELTAALRAVVDLHRVDEDTDSCQACGVALDRNGACPTVRAVLAALTPDTSGETP